MVRTAWALAAFLILAVPGRSADPVAPDEPALRQLNADYVRAFLACDVDRFKVILADDFSAVLADGRIINKAEFLRQAAQPPDAHDFRLHDVSIREFGESAVVAALGTYARADGTGVRTRYSSIFAKRNGQWEIVWVQWTRVVAL